jgi:hypothetical protein
MRKGYYLATLIILASALASTASSQEQVDWTIYVHEGDLNGTLLSDVLVTGQDAQGNSFKGTTDSTGAATISGQPGTWEFTFAKEGYETQPLSYDVTETGEGEVYLLPQGEAALTVYAHEGDLNGAMLSGVSVAGQDGQGNSFEGMTGSDGVVVLRGRAGTWQFTFAKEGYETLYLKYDVAGVMERAIQLSEQANTS